MGPIMSGAKQYDREELLDRSIELFRERGYAATSTAELVAELGVNRKSMYAEFGSKQGLFEASLDRYSEVHLTRVLAPIEAADAGVDGIRQAFANYAAATEGWARGKGCLLCNTAVERAAQDPGSARRVDAYFARIAAGFRRALGNGQRSGDIDAGADIDQLAGFFTTALIGVAASIRAEAPPEQVRAACTVVTSVLDAHRPG